MIYQVEKALREPGAKAQASDRSTIERTIEDRANEGCADPGGTDDDVIDGEFSEA